LLANLPMLLCMTQAVAGVQGHAYLITPLLCFCLVDSICTMITSARSCQFLLPQPTAKATATGVWLACWCWRCCVYQSHAIITNNQHSSVMKLIGP